MARFFSENGTSLQEMCITLVIISSVSSSFIPHIKSFLGRAYDVQIQSDLRTVAMAQELHYIDHQSYIECVQEECTELPGVSRLSPGVLLRVDTPQERQSYKIIASHPKGSGAIFTWDSEKGGLLRSDDPEAIEEDIKNLASERAKEIAKFSVLSATDETEAENGAEG
jgi:Tfp pilus assembly protein PilE